ncbi:glycosyltransferase [Bacillus sp. M6-12]|uniref:glycosyltransferase family 2 protein n=1 Tax=Bacillus sp. M6-12 TaxID=2054166 RepID=UPI000C793321|nr:glycosyltransferase family 2 protein [Bacillus sp. M6-12]PLS17580.1 glycosyltransferase [Bacillus sp. M6-12]
MIEPTLTIVVPCYNEEEMLPETIRQLNHLVGKMIRENIVADSSKILFVDDGSKDNTWSIIYRAGLQNDRIKGLKLARNSGHQNALLAGLFTAKTGSDCVISIDADLQDDIHVIPLFVQKFLEGNEIVYGVRSKRNTDTFFKKTTAESFYKVMKYMGVNLVYNHADFRLMSRRAIQELERFDEVNMFLRGIVPLIGFQTATVYYERKERMAGETKYPLKKMLSFAFDGITSFSVTPIRFVLLLGLASFFVSVLIGIYFLALKFSGNTATGWTSLIISIWLIGGIQLIAIGLIGEYIGKIYKESKRRPKFIVDIDSYSIPMPLHRKNLTLAEEELFAIDRGQMPETN